MQAGLPAMRASVKSSQAGRSDRRQVGQTGEGQRRLRAAQSLEVGLDAPRVLMLELAERAAADALLRATPGAPNPGGRRRRGRGSHKPSVAAWLASGAGADSVQCFWGQVVTAQAGSDPARHAAVCVPICVHG